MPALHISLCLNNLHVYTLEGMEMVKANKYATRIYNHVGIIKGDKKKVEISSTTYVE